MSEATIRKFLGTFINKKVIDITQNDPDEFDPADSTTAYVEFLFEDGGTIRMFTIGDDVGPAFVTTHSDDCNCGACEDNGT